MGIMFVGPMGTGTTFVAEAFAGAKPRAKCCAESAAERWPERGTDNRAVACA